jgi:hypothetical protein
MVFDPQRVGQPCRTIGFCTGRWLWFGEVHVCQCCVCRRIITAVARTPGFGFGAMAAMQGLTGRVESDFEGCVE